MSWDLGMEANWGVGVRLHGITYMGSKHLKKTFSPRILHQFLITIQLQAKVFLKSIVLKHKSTF